MATPMNLTLNQNYEISKSGEYSFSNTGTYEIKIFGSSGNGCKDSNFSILGIEADVGGGGGGGAFGYFRINMTGNDADNNKVKITYSNNDFTVEIKSRNPKNNNIWQANYNVIAGEDGKDLLNGLTTAAGGVISYVSGSNLENAEFLEYAFGSAETNGQNATGMDLDLSIMGLGKGNYSVSGGLGGSYSASDGNSYAGFSGGNGIINTVIPSINQSASDGQKGKIIITRVSNSNSGTGTEGGSGTTPNPDPETPGGSGTTPSQPIEGINILTSTSIKDLKNKIGTEIQNRRKYCGELSDYKSTSITGLNQNSPAITSQGQELINPLLAINSNQNISINTNEPINNYYYINSKITELSNIALNSTSHGCSAACTGLCSTTCGDTCSGKCTTTCSDSCGTGSKGSVGTVGCGGCGSECTGDCGTSSDNNCGSCADNCTGCNAYCGSTCGAWCLATLDSSCSDCTGSCGSNCSGTCDSGCKHACSGSCTDACDNSCGSSCRGDCGTSSSSDSGGYSCSDCTGECYTGCNTRCENGCKNSCGSDNCTGSCLFSCTNTCGNFCTGNNKL